MSSRATLCIAWEMPELARERWEFDHHPAKQEFYRRHDITWEQIEVAFPDGRMAPWPRGEALGDLPVEGAYSGYDDYLTYLAAARRGYRKNYTSMEHALQRAGSLTLPAPIVLAAGGSGLLMAGWRRLCLAWNYGMIPHVWLTTLQGGALT